jgi:hypothetical protein
MGSTVSPKTKLLILVFGALPGYGLVAWFALSILRIGAVSFGVFSVVVASGYAFWLAGAAREYAESPEPLTSEARRAGEEALARLRAKQAQRGGQATDGNAPRAADG